MDAFIHVTLVRLLASSIHTAVLAVLVWILCRSAPRLSPAAQCWLWWLVALQALVGLCVDPVQLRWLPQAVAVTEVASSAQWNAAASRTVVMPLAVDQGVPLWSLVIFMLWAGGIAVIGWATLRHWWRARELLKASAPCTDAPMLQLLARATESLGMRVAPHLRLSHDIDSPVVVGHLRPVLLLSTRVALSNEELDMALVHELTHLRRGDLWWGCIPALVRHLFFFNPFAHLALREYGIAREAGCDAGVVAAGRHSRRDYGQLLLRLGACPDPDTRLAVASPTFHALRKRLAFLQSATFLPRAGSIALLIVVAAGGVMPLRLVAAASPVAAASLPSAVVSGTAPSQTVPHIDEVKRIASGESSSARRVREISAARPARGQALETKKPEFLQRTEFIAARQEEAPPAPAPVYTGERMTVNFTDIPVRALLKVIADTSGRNILVGDAVTGSVTIRLNNVPWDQVLDIVLHTKGLDKRVQGDVIIVGTTEELAARERAALDAYKDAAPAHGGARRLEINASGMRTSNDRMMHADKFTAIIPAGEVLSMEVKGSSSGVSDGAMAESIRIVLKDAELNAINTRHTLQADGSLKLEGESLDMPSAALR